MSTLRDKINHAVEEARNCRPLSYAALDLLEDLFEKELRERISASANKKRLTAFMAYPPTRMAMTSLHCSMCTSPAMLPRKL